VKLLALTRITGLARSTIDRGLRELAGTAAPEAGAGRVRRPGGGRKKLTETDPTLLADLQRLLLGPALAVASREQLTAWLRATTTGTKLLRAGIPRSWRAGDKTGRGPRSETNDIAVLWPPGRQPLLVTAYYAPSGATADECDAVLAEVGRIAAAI